MKRKALFIINPVSGGKKKDQVPQLIQKHLDHQAFDYRIEFSTLDKEIRAIAMEAAHTYDMIVAVGGDGTVNETASAIAGTDKLLGIVPYGSGNGLSRFLQIPMDPVKAIKLLSTGSVRSIDSAQLNGRWFFNMAGMGFDAHISEVFSHTTKRGFSSYLKSSIEEISKYKAQAYHLEIDGHVYDRTAFMLSFANSSQYGNNAHVSPHASLHDGLLDICIIKPFPPYRLPEMGLRMLTKTSESSKFVEIIRGRHIKIERAAAGPVHLDGEPSIIGALVQIEVVPNSLNVIVGHGYKG